MDSVVFRPGQFNVQTRILQSSDQNGHVQTRTVQGSDQDNAEVRPDQPCSDQDSAVFRPGQCCGQTRTVETDSADLRKGQSSVENWTGQGFRPGQCIIRNKTRRIHTKDSVVFRPGHVASVYDGFQALDLGHDVKLQNASTYSTRSVRRQESSV
jgi:hypothetical protein